MTEDLLRRVGEAVALRILEVPRLSVHRLRQVRDIVAVFYADHVLEQRGTSSDTLTAAQLATLSPGSQRAYRKAKKHADDTTEAEQRGYKEGARDMDALWSGVLMRSVDREQFKEISRAVNAQLVKPQEGHGQ